MNIISNSIFHCNNCDANRAFVTIRESTVAAPSSSLLNAKFTFKGTSPPIIFARIVRSMNARQLRRRQFSHTNFLQAKCDFRRKSAVLRFEPPFRGGGGGLRDNIARSGLPIIVNRTFSLGVTAEPLRDRKSAISHQRGQFDPKFQVEGVTPTNYFCP